MNRQQIPSKLGAIISELLRHKGYVAAVDVFMKLGYLDSKDYENWRLKRIPYLEKAIKVNLSRINYIMNTSTTATYPLCRRSSDTMAPSFVGICCRFHFAAFLILLIFSQEFNKNK